MGHPTATSPPPSEATMSKVAPSPPPAATGNGHGSHNTNNNGASHQVGTRQATRSWTRTRQAKPPNANSNAGPSRSSLPLLPRYNSEDHPLSAHKLAARGYHSFQCLGIPFHVKRRYTFLRELGIGAYGCVALARDNLLDCNVAIKKVTRVFERDVLARRALREVAVLRHIGPCDNVTALLDFDATFIEFHEIYLILEASEADLSQIIRSGQSLSDAHLQYFVAQILRGVRYMHAANVIHRDLKPGNLLVNADCQLKLCDFGLARAYASKAEQDDEDEEAAAATKMTPASPDEEESQTSAMRERSFPDSPKSSSNSPTSPKQEVIAIERKSQQSPSRLQTTALDFPGGPLTEYVATRWYRAPEIMLCFRKGYGEQIDMWSVGCIVAELLGGKPIFAGKDYVDQIARINNVLGSPNPSTIAKIGSERAKTYVESLPSMPVVPFAKLYPNASPSAIDLLSKLLCWDPEDRISANEALEHPWLKAYHKSNKNWIVPLPFDRFEEVELLHTIGDFKIGLERESDQMKAELEALQAEEEESIAARLDSANTTTDDGGGGGDQEDGDELGDSEGVKENINKSSSSTTSSSQSMIGSNTRMTRSVSSPGGSPFPTPSSLATSGNETSPTYETDLTSASAPHSVTGSSNSAKKGKSRIMDGLGLMQQSQSNEVEGKRLLQDDEEGEEERSSHPSKVANQERRALDETLANHGLLCGDDCNQVEVLNINRSKYRRRAVTNAPSRIITLKRVGSQGNLQSNSQGMMTKTIDVIQRSSLQREEHDQVFDQIVDVDTWLFHSANGWTSRGGGGVAIHHHHGHNAVNEAIASREGSDTTTVGGPHTADTARHSPVAL